MNKLFTRNFSYLTPALRKNAQNVFSKAERGGFFQKEAVLTNQYKEDACLREYLKLTVPNEILREIEPDLERFGERVSKDIYKLGLECEQNPPTVQHYDAWGNRIDKLITCNAWNKMKKISAEEGLIANAYEKTYNQYSRLYQIVKLYLFSPSSGLYSCPLAMTDGATKTIQMMNIPSFTKEAFERLTSRDPNKFWTSGQWMTERKGGSDVGIALGTDSIAVKNTSSKCEDEYSLYGYKWFSSATDADITITLARIQDENGNLVQGTKGLTMFFLNVRNEQNQLNGIEIHKLKNKLGTKQLPTAELLLDGTKAYRLSTVGSGVTGMSSMLNITRLHNALSAVSYMRRMINLARDYATKRNAFGKVLVEYPLHLHTLSNMEVECRGSFHFLMYVTQLLGKGETNSATTNEMHLLRLLTPLLKLYTAKQAITVSSEGLECFGGQGYIEDTGYPGILRDSQVLSIWEGTTNVLSLDVLRSIEKSNGEVLYAYNEFIQKTCEQALKHEQLNNHAHNVLQNTKDLFRFMKNNQNGLVECARDMAFSLSRLMIANLLIDYCIKTKLKETDVYILKRWCSQDLIPVLTNHSKEIHGKNSYQNNFDIVLAGHPSRGNSQL